MIVWATSQCTIDFEYPEAPLLYSGHQSKGTSLLNNKSDSLITDFSFKSSPSNDVGQLMPWHILTTGNPMD